MAPSTTYGGAPLPDLGPATGEALANLIASGDAKTLDLRNFDPARFS